MTSTKRKTVGQQIKELNEREATRLSDIPDITDAYQQDYIKNLEYCVLHAQKKIDCSQEKNHEVCKTREAFEGDFYVVNLLKGEMVGALRTYFFPKKSCPTPSYDQIVFKYDSKSEKVHLIWSIPNKETCKMYQELYIKNKSEISPNEYALAENVIKFTSGEYDLLCAKLNNEFNRPKDTRTQDEVNKIIDEYIQEKQDPEKSRIII